MSRFVTYAQNFEDLMLWRALHSVQDGFYIDVGAADPDEDSVTRAFYDHGWRGVNIEPSPEHFAAISAARVRDVNLSCLVGHSKGDMHLYNIKDTGLSTVKKEWAEWHAANGYPSEVIGLPVRTLADICREYAPPDIHFLKIDVEGAEEEVLRGADFTAYRPWIVLVEATLPNSRVENWEAWDPLLTKAGYNFVWFDGLNRFYLASERAEELGRAFLTPPNVFDYWLRPRGQEQMALLKEAHALRATIDRLREETTIARASLDAGARAARREPQAGRAQSNTPGAEAGAPQAGGDRPEEEMTMRRASLIAETMAARREAQVRWAEANTARAEANALQTALDQLREESTVTRANLDAEVVAARAEANDARAEAGALLTSTSWKVTAPLRGLSGLLFNPARRQRLRALAELGQEPAGVKGFARIATYGLGRGLARTSVGRGTAHLVRVALPGPYRWLHSRYAVYRNAAASIGAPDRGLPPLPESETSPPPVLVQEQPNSSRQDQSTLSAEEQAMLLRLCAGDGAA